MTTEDDFNAALDANPEDWQTRLVFADWLQERGDPRADGYRALAQGRHQPDTTTSDVVATAFHWWNRDWTDRAYANHETIFRPVSLAGDWYGLLKGGRKDEQKRDFPTRRRAEDAAARAFAKLSPERRAELLAIPPPGDELEPKKATRKKPVAKKPARKPKGKRR